MQFQFQETAEYLRFCHWPTRFCRHSRILQPATALSTSVPSKSFILGVDIRTRKAPSRASPSKKIFEDRAVPECCSLRAFSIRGKDVTHVCRLRGVLININGCANRLPIIA